MFGIGTAALLDETLVPWQAPIGTHAYAMASHLTFGAVMEFVRRQVRGTLSTPQ